MPRRHGEVVRHLTDAIVGAAVQEGSQLPSVPDLAARLGASQGVIREAIRTLEGRRLVVVHPGRGVFALGEERWLLADPAVLTAVLRRRDDPALLVETIWARAVIERSAARATTVQATAGDLRLLAERVELIERAFAEEGGTAIAEESDFHHTVVSMSGNRALANLIEPAHGVLAGLRAQWAPEKASACLAHHRRLLEGLSSGEPVLAEESIAAYARALVGWLSGGPAHADYRRRRR